MIIHGVLRQPGRRHRGAVLEDVTRIDTHHHPVTWAGDWPYAPDMAVDAMAGMYASYDLDEETRKSIDHGAAADLFPRFTP